MAQEIYNVDLWFDYIFLDVGYTYRLHRNEIANFRGDFTENNFRKLFKRHFEHHDGYDDFLLPLVIGFYTEEWDDCEVYCSQEDLQYLKNTNISPYDSIIFSNINFCRICEVVKFLGNLHYCACLHPYSITQFKVYEYQGKKIAKISYDSESG